jgi:hypothetical protein
VKKQPIVNRDAVPAGDRDHVRACGSLAAERAKVDAERAKVEAKRARTEQAIAASAALAERLDAPAAERSRPLVAKAGRIGAVIMPALMLRPTPVRVGDSALVRVLEASIETLKAENELLRRRLAAAEALAARETANAETAIAEFSAITKRLRARAPAA